MDNLSNQITPIRTFYKNNYFRSRLEARWAVYLDQLGYDWLYEPEGFKTSKGNYLPDFYIKRFDFYIEIKPKGCGWDDRWDAFAEMGFNLVLFSSDYPGPYVGSWVNYYNIPCWSEGILTHSKHKHSPAYWYCEDLPEYLDDELDAMQFACKFQFHK